MSPEPVDAATLTEDVELSAACANIAIGSALALATEVDPIRVLQQSIDLWPAEVSDHALVIGQRVALAFVYRLGLDPNVIASAVLEVAEPTTEETNGGVDTNAQ